MFDFITQITNAAAAVSNDIRQARRRKLIERQCYEAQTAIAAAYKHHVSGATAIRSLQSQAKALSVTWRDIIDLGDPYRTIHERRLENLKSRVVKNTEEKGTWFLEPDAATLEALQAPRVAAVRAQAENDLFELLDQSLDAAIQQFDRKCTEIADQAEDQRRTELRALISEKRNILVAATQADTERDDARELLVAAQNDWAERVAASYQSALADKLTEFDEEIRPKLIAKVVRERTAAHWIKEILIKGKSVPHAKLGREYQKSDQHLQDQLINTVTLMVQEDGALVYRARERDAGGRFSFETNYMHESTQFRNQARHKAPDPQVRGPEDRELPFALRFLDQVQIPATTSASLKEVASFSIRSGDDVEQVMSQFEGDVFGALHGLEESSYRYPPHITSFPGTQRVAGWLDKNSARQISVALRPDGLLAVVVKLNDSKTIVDGDKPDKVIQLREDYNSARLMSLLVVTLVTRVLNGSDGARCFPRKCGPSERLHIPSFCIWPLQVDPHGAVTRAETLLEQFESGALKLDNVPSWAVGWTPTIQANALAARFTFTAERHLRVLNATDAGPIEVRKGVNENDALHKLTQWFKYTCLLLGALWASMVLSTVVATNAYTVRELWLSTLAFSLIGVWRCLICWGLSARAREPRPPANLNGWLSRLVSGLSIFVGEVVERAFARRWFLLTGPAIMCLLIATTYQWREKTWTSLHERISAPSVISVVEPDEGATHTPSAEPEPESEAAAPDGEAINILSRESEPESDVAGFQASLYKGVWALPLLAIGLMRHGYMLLYDLVLQRGQLQRKLNSVAGVEQTWAAGRALPSLMTSSEGEAPALTDEKASAISNALARMGTRVTAELAAARSRFDKGSAANAALVAVIGLLAPFSAMEAAKLNEPDEPNTYHGLSTELEKTHDHLVAKLGPLIPKYPPINRIEVTPEVLADLSKLNGELSTVLETLQDIQNNRSVTISTRAETKTAIAALDELSRVMRRMTMSSKVALDADIGSALQELGLLKAVLDKLREGVVIPLTPKGLRPPESARWVDIDLAFINTAPDTGILPRVLAHCDQLGGMRFDINDANINNDKWFSGHNVTGTTDLASLVARINPGTNAQGATADEPWRIYILGLADTQGNAVSNLNLSKRRAEAVKEQLSGKVGGLPIMTLPLGEAGWLADKGLPDQESDANHRSATVYLCPRQIQVADNNVGRDFQ